MFEPSASQEAAAIMIHQGADGCTYIMIKREQLNSAGRLRPNQAASRIRTS